MIGGAVQTQVDAERHRRPCGILLSAVKAYLGRQWRALVSGISNAVATMFSHLVGRLRLQLLEDLERLLFRREGTHLGGGAGGSEASSIEAF